MSRTDNLPVKCNGDSIPMHDEQSRYRCDYCGSGINYSNRSNSYMLQEDKWLAVHPGGLKGHLCFNCMWDTFMKVFIRKPIAADFTKCNCDVNVYLHGRYYMDERLVAVRNAESS